MEVSRRFITAALTSTMNKQPGSEDYQDSRVVVRNNNKNVSYLFQARNNAFIQLPIFNELLSNEEAKDDRWSPDKNAYLEQADKIDPKEDRIKALLIEQEKERKNKEKQNKEQRESSSTGSKRDITTPGTNGEDPAPSCPHNIPNENSSIQNSSSGYRSKPRYADRPWKVKTAPPSYVHADNEENQLDCQENQRVQYTSIVN